MSLIVNEISNLKNLSHLSLIFDCSIERSTDIWNEYKDTL